MHNTIVKLATLFVGVKVMLGGYIDPNTGGMLFQGLVVIFSLASGAVLFFSSQIRRALNRLRRMLRERGEAG